MSNDGDLGCAHCGSFDFIVDWNRGTCVCYGCGCVDPAPLMVAGEGYGATHDSAGNLVPGARAYETFRCGAYHENVLDAVAEARNRRTSVSPPYRRDTCELTSQLFLHLNFFADWAERLSQWREQEPDIPEEDLRLIDRKWEEFTGKYRLPTDPAPRFPDAKYEWGVNGRSCTYVLTKEDCRELLWAIDADRREQPGGAEITPEDAWTQRRLSHHAGVPPRPKPIFVVGALIVLVVRVEQARRQQLAHAPPHARTVFAPPVKIPALPHQVPWQQAPGVVAEVARLVVFHGVLPAR